MMPPFNVPRTYQMREAPTILASAFGGGPEPQRLSETGIRAVERLIAR